MSYVCSAQGGQKRALSPLELKLEVVVSHLKRVLRTDLGSFGRAANSVN